MGTERLVKKQQYTSIEPWGNTTIPPHLAREFAPQVATHEPSILEYWRILVRRKKTVLAVVAGMLIISGVISLLMKPRYTAQSRISVGKENPDALRFKDEGYPVDVSEYNMELDAQVQILTSPSLLLQNIRQLKAQSVETKPSETDANTLKHSAPASQEEELLLDEYDSYLKVTRIPHTPLIEIRFSDRDPQFAADFVNSLVQVYINQNFKTKYESAKQVSGWLASQLEDLRKKTEASQVALAAFQRQTGILGVDDKQNIIMQKLDDLNRELTNAQADRVQKQSLYQATVTADPELLPGVSDNPVINQLKQEQAEVSNTYAKATVDMGPAHPRVQELKNQLKQIDASLKSEYQKIEERNHKAYIVALKREEMLRTALDAQKNEANKLNERTIQYETLRHDVQANQQLYDNLSERLKESGVSAGLRSGNVRVVDYAERPFAPSIPNIPLNLMAGFFFGCVGGILLAFIQERFDDRMHTTVQVEHTAALPLLGVVPKFAPVRIDREISYGSLTSVKEMYGKKTLITLPQEENVLESYRALCLAIFSSEVSSQVTLMTSALPSEGKTTISINCARLLAQKGKRVLLIDADLRAAKIGALLSIDSSSGLTTILQGASRAVEQSAIVQCRTEPNLFVLTAGPVKDNSWQLLDSPLTIEKISEWRHAYSHVIIDTPPVLGYSDGLALAPLADSVVLVVKVGKTPRPAFLRACHLLESVNAKLNGIVANGADLASTNYGSYGYYRYKDKSGKNV